MSPAELCAKLKELTKQHGGSATCNDSGGSGSINDPVHVAFTYTIDGDYAQICITAKPWLVPCSVIESQIRNNLPKVAAATLEEIRG